jgi:cation diffusion facilitator CzcD-associated flavoprotein CzcO
LEVPPVPQASGPTATLTDEEFYQRADLAWQLGGMVALTTTFPDLVKDEDANKRVAEYLRSKVHRIVRNPDVAELLCARGHYLGSRRILTADDYFTIFNQDNVTLVDVNTAPLQSIIPTGLVTLTNEYLLDVIILATGFDSGSGAMLQVDFKGKDGTLLRDKWSDGPVTYLGIGVEGFPNLFMIAQAGSPGIRSHVMVSVEQHVEWISSLIEHARKRGVVSIEATREAELAWTSYVADVVARTLLTRDDTSYIGSNIAGKPRVYTSYVGGVGTYRRICESVQANGYEGWTLITPFDDISGQREWRGPEV